MLGGCFDAEFAPWSNGLIRDIRRGLFVPVLSEIVTVEVANAPVNVQTLYMELVSGAAEVLTVNRSALERAEAYQQRGILTPKFYHDGVHSALATVADVDLLVSWNFTHVVHYDEIRGSGTFPPST